MPARTVMHGAMIVDKPGVDLSAAASEHYSRDA